MKNIFFPSLHSYKKEYIKSDIFAGIIIALVSIPISMGYAQIAGQSPIYGLYGSVFPIILFAVFSTSKNFIFGVDAAPAALVGGVLINMGIESGSEKAQAVVPLITFFVALWLLLFRVIRAGKLVNYISEPVMGGFISGICTVIILMQLPKIFGGSAGTGELFELSKHLLAVVKNMNIASLVMGALSIAVLLGMKKVFPKFPTAIVILVFGALFTVLFPSDQWGVVNLPDVEGGFPRFVLPDFGSGNILEIIISSLSIAVVIMSETLLAENNIARKNGEKIDDNAEIFAFFAGNTVAAFTGCCPINGSVSRSSMAQQFKAKSQLTGIVAGLTMILILVFGSRFIKLLPVPVLAAIVISALISGSEFGIAVKLWKVNKKELLIFIGAFLGVLIFGTVNGVLIGIILSFTEVVFRSSKPARFYLGIQPGHKHFRNLKDSSVIFPISGVVIYKFCASLFFANADIFVQDIENGIHDDTVAVIVDASAIGSIDITGSSRLKMLYESLKERGIKLYLTEHISSLNDQLRALELGYLIEDGAVRRTIHIALKDLGISWPYPLDGTDNQEELTPSRRRIDNHIQELSWAFGSDVDKALDDLIRQRRKSLKEGGEDDVIIYPWHFYGEIDEDEWLEHLEEHIKELADASGEDERAIARRIEERREELYAHILANRPEQEEKFLEHRNAVDRQLEKTHPDIYEMIIELRNS